MSKKIKYEDFEEFVRNRPQPNNPGVYKLWRFRCAAVGYDCHEVKGVSLNTDIAFNGYMWRFPIRPLNEMEYEYYPTFEEAYTSMMERDGLNDGGPYPYPKPTCTFCYQITRLGFGPLGRRDLYLQYWQYDADRREFDQSSCSSYHWGQPGIYGKFLGRLQDQIHFKKGDIVEIGVSRYEDKGKWYSTLGVVIGLPRSVKDVWDTINDDLSDHVAKGNSIESFFSEPDQGGVDSEEYFILYGPYDESLRYTTFRHPIEVRPPSFPVPDKARAELTKYYNEYRAYLNSND